VAEQLARRGAIDAGATPMMSFDEFNALIGVEEKCAMAQRYGEA
jgi:hypothetical protein